VVLVAVLLIGGVITVLLLAATRWPEELTASRLSLTARRRYVTLRQTIWRATWQLIKDHRSPASGSAVTGSRSQSIIAPQERARRKRRHSDYLELLASGGLIALAMGIWFIVAFVKLARSTLLAADAPGRAVVLGAITGLLTVAVHSLVDFGLHITINAVVLRL